MKIETAKKMLHEHGIPFFVHGGRIYADTMQAGNEVFDDVEDITTMTIGQLLIWLGY